MLFVLRRNHHKDEWQIHHLRAVGNLGYLRRVFMEKYKWLTIKNRIFIQVVSDHDTKFEEGLPCSDLVWINH